MSSTETELREEIRRFLNKLGMAEVYYWHNLQGGVRRKYKPKKGIPDLQGIHVFAGHFYIETKGVRGSLTQQQLDFKENVERKGEVVIVCWDYEDFLKKWTAFMKRKS